MHITQHQHTTAAQVGLYGTYVLCPAAMSSEDCTAMVSWLMLASPRMDAPGRGGEEGVEGVGERGGRKGWGKG